MSNRFRISGMRKQYDACMETVHAGGFRNKDGSENRGGSHKSAFWRGYHGEPNYLFAKETLGYACYRAGQDYAKEII